MKKTSPRPRPKGASSKTALMLVKKPASIGELLSNLQAIIREARHQALRAVDLVQVQTCWLVGRHIVEFEQGGAARAA